MTKEKEINNCIQNGSHNSRKQSPRGSWTGSSTRSHRTRGREPMSSLWDPLLRWASHSSRGRRTRPSEPFPFAKGSEVKQIAIPNNDANNIWMVCESIPNNDSVDWNSEEMNYSSQHRSAPRVKSHKECRNMVVKNRNRREMQRQKQKRGKETDVKAQRQRLLEAATMRKIMGGTTTRWIYRGLRRTSRIRQVHYCV